MTTAKLYITIAALIAALLGMGYINTLLKSEIAVKDIQLEASAQVIGAHKTSEDTTNAIDKLRADFNANVAALQTSMKKGFKEAKQNDPTAKKWAEDTIPCSVLATDPGIPDALWLRYCNQGGFGRLAVPAPAKDAANTRP